MNEKIEHIAAGLMERGEKLATAESCTGGLVGAALTGLPGSSAWYVGGVVAYSNDLKGRLLGVPAEVLARHGAVSAAVADAMAEGVREATGAGMAVALTGVAGPDGGTPDKPVGLVFICVASPDGATTYSHRFEGDRAAIRAAATEAALEHLCAAVRPMELPPSG